MAASVCSLIFASVLAILIVRYAAAAAPQFIDTIPNRIESIAEDLCEGSEWEPKRIVHQSTIDKLADYFGSQHLPAEFAACRDRYLKPLQELKGVLGANSDNICSRNKMELINEFHWNHIVAGLNRKWLRAESSDSQSLIPEPLRIFFMHYADELAEQCKETLVHRLQVAASDNDFQAESLASNKLGGSLDNLSNALVPKSKVENYDSFSFVWDQVIAKQRVSGIKVQSRIDNLTQEPVIAMTKVKDPSNAWAVQRKCRHELRPVYQDTTLPVMRLLEMGYGSVDEKSGQIVRGNPLIANWYAITQLCELLIPINFYQDETLHEGEAVMLSNFEAAKGLGRPEDVVSIDDLPQTKATIEPVKQLGDMLASAADEAIQEKVKLNLEARGHLA